MALGVYYWQQTVMKDLTKQHLQEKTDLQDKTDALEGNIDKLTNELDEIKNPFVPEYCTKGTLYENSENNYRVCIPSGWIKAPTDEGSDRVEFIPKTGKGENYFYIALSTDILDDALKKYSKDMYVDSGNREYAVAGTEGYQFFGKVLPDMKRGITVFPGDSITFEIAMENSNDASYNSNVESYKSLVKSFEFTE